MGDDGINKNQGWTSLRPTAPLQTGEPSPRDLGGRAPTSPRARKWPGFPPRPVPLAPLQPQRREEQEGAGGLPTPALLRLLGMGVHRMGLRALPDRGSKALRFKAGWWRGLSKQGTQVPRCQAEKERKSQTQLGEHLGQPPQLCGCSPCWLGGPGVHCVANYTGQCQVPPVN